MKKYTVQILTLAVLVLCSCGTNKTKEQKQVAQQNENNAETNSFSEEQAEFLVMANNTRRMGKMVGQLAQEKGGTPAVKEYGAMLVKDQTEMMSEIEKIARIKNIALLDSLSGKMAKGYESLKSKEDGEPFDRKIIDMTSNGHDRDVKQFKKATEFDDAEIAAFSTKYLPTVEKHLATVKELDENYDK